MDAMTTTTDPTFDRLNKEIGLRSFADRYLDQNEEREVLQIASQLGVQAESAASIIAKACEDSGILREVVVRDSIHSRLAAIPGKIDHNTFEQIVAATQTMANRTLNDREVRRLVVAGVEEVKRAQVKHGWFSNWYADQKRDLGVV